MNRDLSTSEWLREAGRRIGRGSGRLCWLIARRASRGGAARLRAWWKAIMAWLGEASGFDWLLRVGVLVVAAVVVRKVAPGIVGGVLHWAEAASWLLWPGTVVWCIAAYRVGREGWEPPAEPEPEPEPDPEAEADAPEPDSAPESEPDDEPPLPTREQLAAALHEVGDPHAHLVPLAERLKTTTARVREGCAAAGIPISGGVRMKGRGVSPGIAQPHFPPLLSLQEPPSGPVVAAGESNNNSNNTTAVRAGSGETLIITDDPDNPHRAHVRYEKGTT